jgi:autoinducer 2-degrading protein
VVILFIACVTVWVKPEDRKEFIKATKENASASRTEHGNLRFDILECLDDPNQFFLYEVYKNEDGMKAHKETAHYNKWRDIVAEMMVKPRLGVKHKNIFPTEEKGFLSE